MDADKDSLFARLADLADQHQAISRQLKPLESRKKTVTAEILTVMEALDLGRHQLDTGAVVLVVSNPPRLSIVKEQLLAAGVDPDVIKDATKVTPVSPFVRIDGPKGTLAEDAVAAPTDADAPTTTH